jgi:Mg-chelatase subunit ChlD
LLLAVLTGLPSSSVALELRRAEAQEAAMAYRLEATWQGVHAGFVPAALPWPREHAIGGIGSGGGRLLATDRTDDVVRVFQGGREVDRFGESGPAPGQLADAHDVLALADGRLMVSDTGNDRVQLLAADGAPLRAWPVARPLGLARYDAGAGEHVAVVSGAGRELVGIEPDGGIVLRQPLGRLGMPERVAWGGLQALGGPTFYVTDALPQSAGIHQVDGRVSIRHALRAAGAVAAPAVVDSDFLPLETLWAGVAEAGLLPLSQLERFRAGHATTAALPRVRDLEIDAAGGLFAAVPGRGVVALGDVDALRHDLERQHQPEAGPQVIAAGDEVIYAGGHARVHARTPRGALAWQVALAAGTVDVAVDGDRRLVLTDEGHVLELAEGREVARSRRWRDEQHHAVALSAAGGRVALLDLRAQELRLLDAGLRQSAAIALAPPGVYRGVVDVALTPRWIVLARASAGRAEIRDMDGRVVAEAEIPSGAIRVAAGPQGELVALSAAGWAMRFDAAGRILAAWPAGAPSDSPVDLAVGEGGRVYVADSAGRVRVYVPDARVPATVPPAATGRCTVLANKGVAPERVVLGQSVEVTLSLEGACPQAERQSDVVLAIDRSTSMRGAKLLAAQDAALAFAAQMDPLLARVAVVGFAGRAERLLSLTSDRARIIDAVLGLEIESWTDVMAALEAAQAALTGGLGRPEARRVVVLLTDGRHWDPLRGEVVDPPGLPALLERLRADRIERFAVGLGDDANAPLLRAIAGDEDHYLRSPTPGDLRAVYRDIARRIEATVLLRELELRDIVPPDMVFVPGSGRPVEPAWEPETRTLVWRLDEVPEPGLRLSYRLRPTVAGLRPTNVEARSRFTDGLGQAGEALHPVPHVLVVDPAAPTSGAGGQAWLPLVLAERCKAQRVHVAMLLDASTSMAAPLAETAGAPSKRQAQHQAVLTFLDAIDPTRTTLSVLRFDLGVELVARTTDPARVDAALAAMGLRPGSRIDRALEAAADELVESGALRPSRGRPVVLLLSDGLTSAGSSPAAIDAAAALRARGAELRAIALGSDADPDFLAALTGGRAGGAVDDVGGLEALVRRIARQASACPSAWRRDRP